MNFSEFLKNKPLEEIIESAPIDDNQKKELLEMIPYLNEGEREDVLQMLENVFLLEAEKKGISQKTE